MTEDIVVPDRVSATAVVCFIADLCHEWSTAEHPDVAVLIGGRKDS